MHLFGSAWLLECAVRFVFTPSVEKRHRTLNKARTSLHSMMFIYFTIQRVASRDTQKIQ